MDDKTNNNFRFEINPQDQNSLDDESLIIEVIRKNLVAMLEVVILTYKGKEVKVDGFALFDDEKRIYPLFLQK